VWEKEDVSVGLVCLKRITTVGASGNRRHTPRIDAKIEVTNKADYLGQLKRLKIKNEGYKAE
jgi:hypothetical protein